MWCGPAPRTLASVGAVEAPAVELLETIRSLRLRERREVPYTRRWYRLLDAEADAIARLKAELGGGWSEHPLVIEWLVAIP